MNLILSIAQIAVAILLGVSILLQQRGTALGAGFGGGDGTLYGVRRGIQKKLHWATYILAAAFLALAVVRLWLA